MRTLLLIPCLTMMLPAQAPPDQARPLLGLRDALASTLARQPRMAEAENQVQAAQARLEQTRLEGLGSLAGNLAYTPRQKGLQEEIMGERMELRMNETWAFTVSLEHPLFTWGALGARKRAGERELAATESARARTRQQLVFEATQAYAQAVLQEEALEVARQACGQQEDFLRVAQARVRAGSAARLDALKAELGVAQARSALSEAANRARLAREGLATLTEDGRFREARLEALPEPERAEEGRGASGTSAPVEPGDGEDLPRRRQDLEGLRRQAEALSLGVRAALASSRPSLSLRASVTQQHASQTRMFNRDSQQYALGLALSWDALGAMRGRARAAELRAQERALRESLRGAESGAALEVRQARASLAEARGRLAVQEAALKVAEEQARIARLAYAEGTLTAVELSEAESALTGARHGRSRARAEAFIASATLTYALGD